jgi:hypothetical protein
MVNEEKEAGTLSSYMYSSCPTVMAEEFVLGYLTTNVAVSITGMGIPKLQVILSHGLQNRRRRLHYCRATDSQIHI